MRENNNIHSHFLWKVEQLLNEDMPELYAGQLDSLSDLKRTTLTIDSNIGNNSFSYIAGRRLYIAPVCEYSEEYRVEQGNDIVFSDEWGGEVLNNCGLKTILYGKTEGSKTPFYLCDNHNLVLEAWQQIAAYSPPLTLVHIDQHKDDAHFRGNPDDFLLESRICDYIDFAKDAHWIKPEYYSFTESTDFLEGPPPESLGRCILNLDLDIFDPIVTHISTEDKIALIKNIMPHTELLTIATSPGFIDQKRARALAELFIQYL